MAVGDLLFAFDPSKESPESVKKKRAIAQAILATNRAPRTIGEGLNALGDGIVANVMNRRASEAEGMGRQSAQKAIAALIAGSDFGGSSGPGASGFAAEAPSIQPDYASQRVAQAHGDNPMSAYRDAIASIESEGSGDYGAVGPTNSKLGRALGRYQIMEANIGPWSREVLGREVTPDEFMANPQLQDAIFDGKFGSYVNQFGPEGAAQAWFAGPGGVGKVNRKDVLGTDVGTYGQKFLSALGPQASNPVQAIDGIMNDGPVQVAESEADVQAMEAAMAQEAPQAFNMPNAGNHPNGLPAQAAPGTIAKASDGQTYQYVETRGMAGASGDFGWIRVNAGSQQQPVQVAQASMPNQMSDAEALRLLGARAEPQPMQQAPQPMQAMNSGPTMEQLLQASQNPWLSESQRGIVNMLLQQQMQQNDPMRQMEMERARLELEQMRNPQEKLINAGDGNLYNPNSGEWISAPGRDQDGFRRATPEEAAQYGAPSGQFGPDGRFYPINPPSGTALSVDPTTGAVTFQQGSGVKPLTEGQSKDTVYATRAEGSLGTLDKFGDTLTNPLERAAEYDPTGLFRSNQSPEFQRAKQAGDEFLQAILRKDTGAAITTDEMQSYGRTYLPMPGDGPEVLRQKQVARKRALEALKAGMPPQAILQQEKALANTADQSNSDAIPSDVDPADWEFMTPEEKALFQ